MEKKLNTQQEEALKKLLSFVLNDDKAFVLNGYAGTGKTFLINHFINEYPKYIHYNDNIKETYTDRTISITATTNKAVEVLKQYYPNARTLYSCLGLQPKKEDELIKTWRHGSYPISGLLVVDESSMLSKKALEIVESIPNLKTIYIGDSTQLPPPNEEVSPVFTKGYPSYSLTELMRQPQGILQDNCESCRRAVVEERFPVSLFSLTTIQAVS